MDILSSFMINKTLSLHNWPVTGKKYLNKIKQIKAKRQNLNFEKAIISNFIMYGGYLVFFFLTK